MADMNSKPSWLADLSDTRALAQKLWGQCRDSSSAYSAVTSDLRKLRNVLEDIEEHIHENVIDEAQGRKVLNRVSKCQAILGGLDLSLQSFRCSNKQLLVQPEAVAAAKASVQIATDGLLVIFHDLSSTGNGHLGSEEHEFPIPGGVRRSIASETSSDGRSDTQHTATAANMTLSNSARIVSVGRLPLPEADEHQIEDAIEPSQSLVSYRKAPVPSSHPRNWRKPFTLPDPLSFDVSEASSLLTGRRGQPHGNAYQSQGRAAEEIAVQEATARANALGRSFPFDSSPSSEAWDRYPRRSSASPRTLRSCSGPEIRRPGISQAPSQTTMYVPYRPWYSPLGPPTANTKAPPSRDSVANVTDNRQSHAYPTQTRSLAISPRTDAPPTPIISVTDYSAIAGQGFDIALVEDPKAEDFAPDIVDRTPPQPVSVVEEAHPPASSSQHTYHITNASPEFSSTASLHEDTSLPSPEESPTLASLILRVKSCSEDVCDLNHGVSLPIANSEDSTQRKMINRRASTGEIDFKSLRQRLAEFDAKRDSDVERRRTAPCTPTENPSETIAFAPSSHSSFAKVNLPRSRSLSAPELRTPKLRPTILAHMPIPTPERSFLSEPAIEIGRSSVDSSISKSLANNVGSHLEETCIEQICSTWNSRLWAKTESHLTHHLSTINNSDSQDGARRARHLLGVCASYRGQWHRALAWFLSVVNKPVEDAQRLDQGDRTAFCWLGDTYAMLNRKEEALLSYCLAGSCNQSDLANARPHPRRCLLADQKAFRGMVSKATFKAIWSHGNFSSGHVAEGEILHSTVVSQAAAQTCLQNFGHSADGCTLHGARHGYKRDTKDSLIDSPGSILITPACFEIEKPWPMPNDPFFSMQGVAQGRLMTQEVDLLHAVQQYPGSLLPRYKLSLDRMSGFTCETLPHLITTLRETLQTLAMEWSETVSAKGLFFRVRYNMMQENIATTNYFAIEIIRVPLRAGYSLAFCPESLCSARPLDSTPSPKQTGSSNILSISIIPTRSEKELKASLRAALKTVSKRHHGSNAISQSTASATTTMPPFASSSKASSNTSRTTTAAAAATADQTSPLPELGPSHS